MKRFFIDLFKNEFGTTKTLIVNGSDRVRNLLRHVLFIWVIALIVLIITGSISGFRHSKSRIKIEEAYYDEFSDSCTVTYTIENKNKSNLVDFTLQYKVKDKNTGKTIYSGEEYVGYLFHTIDSSKDHFSINFKTTQIGADGTEHRTSYSDMVIEYKIIKTNFSDGFLLYWIKEASVAVVCLPLVYYLGKFSFVVFPVCLYVYSNNIKNFVLRNLVKIVLLIPYLWGALLYGQKDFKGKIAVDVNGNPIGVYDPETGLITKNDKVVVPINKDSIKKK